MKRVNLNSETVKILGVHFSYNKNLEQDKNFSEHILKIESILKLWRMRQLTLEGRITVFKSLELPCLKLSVKKVIRNEVVNC